MNNIFINHKHESHFLEVRRKISDTMGLDTKQMDSLAYLLSGNAEIEQKISPYLKQNKFDFEEMFKEQKFTSEMAIMAKLAVLIYTGEEDFRFSDFFKQLGEETFKLALYSAYLFYRSPVPNNNYQTTDTNSYIN